MSGNDAPARRRRPRDRVRARRIAYARWLGLIMCFGGLAVIAVGWNGMAGVETPDAQLPYLLSAGAAGLALVFLGATLIVVAELRAGHLKNERQAAQLAAVLSSAPGRARPRRAWWRPDPAPRRSRSARRVQPQQPLWPGSAPRRRGPFRPWSGTPK